MLGDYPVESVAFFILLPVIIAGFLGLVAGMAFAVVAGLTAANRGLAILVRRKMDAIRARRADRDRTGRGILPRP